MIHLTLPDSSSPGEPLSGNTLNRCTEPSTAARPRHRSPTLQATRHHLDQIAEKSGAVRAELETLHLPPSVDRELDDIDDLLRIVCGKLNRAGDALDTLIECEVV